MVNMKVSNNTIDENCSDMREYSYTEELVNNIPYIVMTILGTIIFAVGFSSSVLGLITAAAYLAYGITGAFWIMIFVCPYCRYWNSRSCPCGYGRIAARFREKSSVECFNEKFKRHIPVIVPLWFIPILVGLPIIMRNFSWTLLVLLFIFTLDAFVVLPLISTKHGCKECPQKDLCPWMKLRGKPAG
jgi:hypothetical protein